MKNGYHCQCGWSLGRGNLTRREYADKKKQHATGCDILSAELRRTVSSKK